MTVQTRDMIAAVVEQQGRDLRAVLSTAAGLRVFARLVYGMGQIEESSLTSPTGAVDPLLMAAREGRRHFAREVLGEIRALDHDLSLKLFEARFVAERDLAIAQKKEPTNAR